MTGGRGGCDGVCAEGVSLLLRIFLPQSRSICHVKGRRCSRLGQESSRVEEGGFRDKVGRERAVRHEAGFGLTEDARGCCHAHDAAKLRGGDTGDVGGIGEGDLVAHGDTGKQLEVA